MSAFPSILDQAAELVHPLDEFYGRMGVGLPPLECVEYPGIPQPYRSLLVHDRDMTSTLEAFHGEPLVLGVVGTKHQVMEYFREVVLLLSGSGKPVEFGAIKIYLESFPARIRWQVLEEYWPLGRILKENDLPFVSAPGAFLRMASDRLINELLRLSGVQTLYGRRNTLSHPDGRVLAEIVEILPPVDPNRRPG